MSLQFDDKTNGTICLLIAVLHFATRLFSPEKICLLSTVGTVWSLCANTGSGAGSQ